MVWTDFIHSTRAYKKKHQQHNNGNKNDERKGTVSFPTGKGREYVFVYVVPVPFISETSLEKNSARACETLSTCIIFSNATWKESTQS